MDTTACSILYRQVFKIEHPDRLAHLRLCERPSQMTKPEEYRFNAEECERMAENSLNPRDKAAWLRLAKRWLGMTMRN
jgi:hypothetical protein